MPLTSILPSESPLTNPDIMPSRLTRMRSALRDGFINIIFASWLNVLLVCIPISWTLNFARKDADIPIFVFSFLAIIPLAKLLAFATDELSTRVKYPLAGLLNVTLGNTVAFIIAILALVKGKLLIVQYSLIGSVLANLLVRLGMTYFVNGAGTAALAGTSLSLPLLDIGVVAILLPAVYVKAEASPQQGERVLHLSRLVAIIMLLVYVSYLVFHFLPYARRNGETSVVNTSVSSPQGRPSRDPLGSNQNASGEGQTRLSVWMSFVLLVVATAVIGATGELLVRSIDGLTEGGHISELFVGLVLLEVPHVVEHVTVAIAQPRSMSSVNEAVDSSIQIILFVLPLTVILGWILNKPLALLFDQRTALPLVLALPIVHYVIQDRDAGWLEGMALICLYVISGITFWFYPAPGIDVLPACN